MLRCFSTILGVSLLALGLAGCCNGAARQGDHPDVASLCGVWQITDATVDGVKPPPEEMSRLRAIQFAFDGVYLQPCTAGKGCEGRAEVTLAPDASPKQITLVEENSCRPCGGTHLLRGIYDLQGDVLTYCVAQDGVRPTALRSLPGSGWSLYVLTRQGGAVPPSGATVTLVDKETQQTMVVPAETKVVFPERHFKNGVLEVWYPQVSLEQLSRVTRDAIAATGDFLSEETAIQNKNREGLVLFGKTADGTHYTCTLAPGGNFILARIHYGDWGDLGKSAEIANNIADFL